MGTWSYQHVCDLDILCFDFVCSQLSPVFKHWFYFGDITLNASDHTSKHRRSFWHTLLVIATYIIMNLPKCDLACSCKEESEPKTLLQMRHLYLNNGSSAESWCCWKCLNIEALPLVWCLDWSPSNNYICTNSFGHIHFSIT